MKPNIKMKKILLSLAVVAACSCADKGNPTFEQVASGVWKVEVGSPERVDLLSELHITPKIDAINAMEDASLPVSKEDIRTEVIDGKTFIRFPLDKGEKIFGLGLNFKTVAHCIIL